VEKQQSLCLKDIGLDELIPGQRISHAELGHGVIVEAPREGYVRAFFPGGERRVPLSVTIGAAPLARIATPFQLFWPFHTAS
jgi:hypothetical protein